jgi:hypothetical protein
VQDSAEDDDLTLDPIEKENANDRLFLMLSARAYSGRMLWLRANRLPGSYRRLTAASR